MIKFKTFSSLLVYKRAPKRRMVCLNIWRWLYDLSWCLTTSYSKRFLRNLWEYYFVALNITYTLEISSPLMSLQAYIYIYTFFFFLWASSSHTLYFHLKIWNLCNRFTNINVKVEICTYVDLMIKLLRKWLYPKAHDNNLEP